MDDFNATPMKSGTERVGTSRLLGHPGLAALAGVVAAGAPIEPIPQMERVEVPKKDGVVHHPVVTDTRSLLWITNQNTITQHVWTSRVPDLLAIEDGTAEVTDGGVRLIPSRAVLHRSAIEPGAGTDPAGLHDCLPLKR